MAESEVEVCTTGGFVGGELVEVRQISDSLPSPLRILVLDHPSTCDVILLATVYHQSMFECSAREEGVGCSMSVKIQHNSYGALSVSFRSLA